MAEIIEFYKPAKKPAAPVEPVEVEGPVTQMPAAEVLTALLQYADIKDVLVLMRHRDGTLSFTGNLADLGESILFIERVKHRVMVQDAGPRPPRDIA
jgi:hypothetical protein